MPGARCSLGSLAADCLAGATPNLVLVDAGPGFEPGPQRAEHRVLPLHHPAPPWRDRLHYSCGSQVASSTFASTIVPYHVHRKTIINTTPPCSPYPEPAYLTQPASYCAGQPNMYVTC